MLEHQKAVSRVEICVLQRSLSGINRRQYRRKWHSCQTPLNAYSSAGPDTNLADSRTRAEIVPSVELRAVPIDDEEHGGFHTEQEGNIDI